MKQTPERTPAAVYWNERFRAYGHTGDANAIIYQYDQPLRLRLIDKALSRSGVQHSAETRILDVGCGTGDLISLFVHKGSSHITGVDFSGEVVSYVKRRFQDNKQVKVLMMAAEDLAFAPSTFHLVTCVNVLQHITDDQGFLRAVANLVCLTRSSGHILVMDFSPFRSGRKVSTSQLVVRSRSKYVSAFEEAGCRLSYEVGLPRIGVRVSRNVLGVVGRVRKLLPARQAQTTHDAGMTVGRPQSTFKDRASDMIIATVLKLAAPFDRLLVKFPARYSDMRILIFEKGQGAY